MRTKKNGKWKIVLVVVLAILLVKCTYIAFIGQKLLPDGLIWQFCTDVGQGVLKPGEVAVIDRASTVELPAVIAWEQGGHYAFGVGQRLEGEKIVLGDVGYGTPEPIDSSLLRGKVIYTIAGIGYVVTAIQDGGIIVLALDFLFIAFMLFCCATTPKRKELKRREELIRLFDFYGEKYDLEDAGVDF